MRGLAGCRLLTSPAQAVLAGAAPVAAVMVDAAPTAGNGPRRSTWLAAPVPAPRPGGPTAQQLQLISNAELYELCAVQPVEQHLRRTCGRWVGHVLRLGHDRRAKQLLFGQLSGASPAPAARGARRSSLLDSYITDTSPPQIP